MMKCKCIMLSSFVLSSLVTYCATWSEYQPGANIVLPEGEHVVQTLDELAVINSLSTITNEAGAYVVFNVPQGDVWRVNSRINGDGGIIKRGEGELHLEVAESTSGAVYNYYSGAGINIESGWVFCPTNTTAAISLYLGPVTIAEGSTFVTPSTANRVLDPASLVEVYSLSGAGVVTNYTQIKKAKFLITGNPSQPAVFSGKIAGPGIELQVGGHQYLTGMDSDYAGTTYLYFNWAIDSRKYGILGISKFGRNGAASSIGKGSFIIKDTCGRLIYLGEGETTDRTISWYRRGGDNEYTGITAFIDAGANGGVTFEGAWGKMSWAKTGSDRVVLTGSNTTACTLSNAIADLGVTNPLYIIKRGKGTWKFADHAERKNNGVIAVEDGKIQFTSIADTNVVCSLGLANSLQSAYSGPYDAQKSVDYAYLLGTASTRGTMEYVGEKDAVCSNRIFAIQGEGAIINGAAEGVRLDLRGAKNAPGVNGTLVLAGANLTRCVFADTGDCAEGGKLGLTKEGSGVWRLEGRQDFSGPLTVKAGTLEVQGAQTNLYRHYKFVVRGTYVQHMQNNDAWTQFRGIAFYNKDGENQTLQKNMEYVKGYATAKNTIMGPAGDWNNLKPGQYSWARTGSCRFNSGSVENYNKSMHYDIDTLFDISRNIQFVWYDEQGLAKAPIPNDPSRWAPIYIRMPDAAEEITAFDVMSQTVGQKRTMTAWSLMASEDGVEWKEVAKYDYNETTIPAAQKWFSDPSEEVGTSPAAAVRPGKGYQIQGSVKYDDVGTLQNVSAVKVAAGATLKARGYVKLPTLTVDCENGNGTIDGFDFAEEGVVNLVGLNVNAQRTGVALTFLNTSAETLAKLNDRNKWTVALDGVASDKFNVRIKSDGVVVSQKNLIMIIR